jgi:hypothetical protein
MERIGKIQGKRKRGRVQRVAEMSVSYASPFSCVDRQIGVR